MLDKRILVPDESITVIAPARLHLGFLDLHRQGETERVFGSLGLCLEEIYTQLSVQQSDHITISGHHSGQAQHYVEHIIEHFGIDSGVDVKIQQSIPEHAGLGSGTQLSLAIGTAITRLFKIDVPTRKIARILGRGERSGIGVGSFMQGGVLVDGGRGKHTEIPPIISHMSFPAEWRIVLIFDHKRKGISGVPEDEVFNTLPTMDESISAQLCRIVLMQALPALSEQDCDEFGAAVQKIQEIVGDYFKVVQGNRYSSPIVSKVLQWFSKRGAKGIGQSSWGPTGFALFANETTALQIIEKAREYWGENDKSLRFMLCRARNKRAEIISNSSSLNDELRYSQIRR